MDRKKKKDDKSVDHVVYDIIKRRKLDTQKESAAKIAQTDELQSQLLSQLTPEKSVNNVLQACKLTTLSSNLLIPLETAELNSVDLSKTFWLFQEHTLSFEKAFDGCDALFRGRFESVGDFKEFERDILSVLQHIPDVHVPKTFIYYILFKLSVGCGDLIPLYQFLKKFGKKFTSKNILPVFVNFGIDFDDLKLPRFVEKLSIDTNPSTVSTSLSSKFYNIQLVLKVIEEFAIAGKFKADDTTEKLVKILIQLAFSTQFRKTVIFSKIASLVDAILTALPSDNNKVYAKWLHLELEPLYLNLDLCGIFLRPGDLRQEVILIVLRQAIQTTSKFKGPFKTYYFEQALRMCNVKFSQMSLLEVYCVLELLNILLPPVSSFSQEQLDSLFQQLNRLESCLISPVADCPDLVRIRSSANKLRSMLMLKPIVIESITIN